MANIDWNELVSAEEVDVVLMASNSKIQVIYKHSYSCGICYRAKNSIEKISGEDASGAEFHMVDVIQERSISKYIAEKTGITHESPQMLILKDGEVIWHASHFNVKLENLLEQIG